MGSLRKKIAIVGSGCSGLGAAWALKDSEYEVHLFEKASKLGGHTNTQPFETQHGTLHVDTGFIVMNTATYPNFIRFLKEVGVPPVPTEMTFGVSRDHGVFEWSGEAQGVFAQRRNLFRPQHWRMIFDIVRFNQFALDILTEDGDGVERLGFSKASRQRAAEMTIGEYLDREGYCQSFRDDYLIPMTAAVWSTSPDKASLEFPAKTLIRFMWNHHLLTTIAERPPWLTIPGGSRRYIEAVLSSFAAGKLHVHTSSEITSIVRPAKQGDGPVTLSWVNASSGRIEGDSFEHVILACHGDEVLPLLTKQATRNQATATPPTTPAKQKKTGNSISSSAEVSQKEIEIFSAFQTTENVCYLHSDLALMPKRRKVWTAWNYLVNSAPSKLSHPAGVSLTYCMNILQHFPESKYGPVLVTMNPDREPEPGLSQGKYLYRHPLYTVESVRAQSRLEEIQNTRGVSYCGAWTKYGFHEDGFSSGLRAAIEHLGAKLPFDFVDSTYSRGHLPVLGWQDYALRLVLLFLLFWVRLLDRAMQFPVIAPMFALVSTIMTAVLDISEKTGVL